MMDYPLVIDDFLHFPDSYRKYALDREYQSFHFPNCVFHGIAGEQVDGLVPRLLHEMLHNFHPTLSFFRKSPEGQEEPHLIHTDVDMGDVTALLYLNPEPKGGDGTVFWGRKEEGFLDDHSGAVGLNHQEIGHLIPHKRSEEGKHPERGWSRRKLVEAKFNRMIIFPSYLYHSRAIPENYGHGEDARLTQVTFGKGSI